MEELDDLRRKAFEAKIALRQLQLRLESLKDDVSDAQLVARVAEIAVLDAEEAHMRSVFGEKKDEKSKIAPKAILRRAT